ncbi:hypothetical protein ACI2K6_06635 [Microbacterium sp. NPDC006705]|uniref:hypothetical protein n=1 Tax=Microbacterium TaxID=33882 RepID=UPI00249DB226|nr:MULTISPECIES: hypothetical protein [Microbacterium]WHE36679.1 hypothetical protein P6897_02840 [Microbacterium sp. BDGP8]WRK17924.1 hypothetical protein VC184_02595 [Microbacterium plantarum]
MPRYLVVDADLAGFAQYQQLEADADGLWWVVRQIDEHPAGARRYGAGAVVVDDWGMLSDQPSTASELDDDELTTPITADEFERRWNDAC